MLNKTSMVPDSNEQDLVAATRAGDDRAYEELYSRYRERIFAFIRSRVHDHGRAEDIAQEVFISALRRLRASDQRIAFKPWIYEIAKNACIDEFRRGTRMHEVPLETDGEMITDGAVTPTVAPAPAAAIESKQALDDLRGAFDGLSENHHQLLVMREFEGLSYDEIGERLGMSRPMVESALFRARRKLSTEYHELASGRRCEQVQHAINVGTLRTSRRLGLRERRQFARHLSHCQVCRHVALQAGVDSTLIKPRRIPAKIAALLPFPVWRLPWRGGRGAKLSASSAGHHVAATGGRGFAGFAKTGGTYLTARTAAGVAVLALAGAGGVEAVSAIGHTGRPVDVSPTAFTGAHATGKPSPQSSAMPGMSAARTAAVGATAPRVAMGGGIGSMKISPSPAASRAAGRAKSRSTSSSGKANATASTAERAGANPGSQPAATPPARTRKSSTSHHRVVPNTLGAATKTVKKVVTGVEHTVSSVVKPVTNSAPVKQVESATKPVTGAAKKVVSTVTGSLPHPSGGSSSASSEGAGSGSSGSGPVPGVGNTLKSAASQTTSTLLGK